MQKDAEIERLNVQVEELKEQSQSCDKNSTIKGVDDKSMSVSTSSTAISIEKSELTRLHCKAKDSAAIKARKDDMKVQFDKLQMEKNETQNALDKLESEVEEKEQERDDTGDKCQGNMDKLKKENEQLKVMLQMQK